MHLQGGDIGGSHTAVHEARIYTGHSLFDHIVHLYPGMSVLVLDETFSEGRNLIKTLFRDPEMLTEIHSSHYAVPEKSRIAISLESLQDVSIQVNQLRRTIQSRVLVHSYLPELLIRRGSDEVLRLLEIWKKDVAQTNHLEFYLLPKGTFEDLEKKLMAVLDGVLEISVVRKENIFNYYFTPIRVCDPQYHLKTFQYKLVGGSLLIEWEGQFIDKLPGPASPEEILRALTERSEGYVIEKKEVSIENISFNDYLLLTSLNGRRVSEVRQLFPDRWDEIVEKLSRWVLAGMVKLVEVEPEPKLGQRNSLKLKSRLLLSIPSSLSLKLIRMSRGFIGSRVRTVPLDAHIAVLTAMKNVVDFVFGDRPDLKLEVQQSTRFFGELSARETALKYVKILEGTPYTVFKPEHLPKIVALTLKTGWDLDISIVEKDEDTYVFEISDCHLCKDVRSETPFCDKFVSSVVVGAIAICYRIKSECYEFMCRATGADRCAFQITLKPGEKH
ncbi:hypothetical protein HRbin01_00641 [archaeon HR01]|nr:hypothetical protein HRbin01_00641 [archaeon HR01]